MYVVIVDGIMGSGKTLAMTVLSRLFVYLMSVIGVPPVIYSNYGVKDSKPFSNFDDFLNISQEDSSFLLLDESHIDLDSRSSTTSSVKYFTHLVFFLRKMRCTLFLTTPDFDNLDSRVRMVCNLYIHARKDTKYFYYDFYDIQSNRFIKTFRLPKELAYLDVKQAYDTRAFVSPIEYPVSRTSYEQFLIKLKDINDDYFLRLDASETTEGLSETQLHQQKISKEVDYVI